MGYENKRLSRKGIFSCLFIIFVFMAIYLITRNEEDVSSYIQALLVLLAGGGPLVYSSAYEKMRDYCKQYGERIPGRITSVYRCNWDEYYLAISFFDGKEKRLITGVYTANPNFCLKDCNCNIYKWKDRYVEADFNSLSKDEQSQVLQIPVINRSSIPFKKSGKVEEV